MPIVVTIHECTVPYVHPEDSSYVPDSFALVELPMLSIISLPALHGRTRILSNSSVSSTAPLVSISEMMSIERRRAAALVQDIPTMSKRFRDAATRDGDRLECYLGRKKVSYVDDVDGSWSRMHFSRSPIRQRSPKSHIPRPVEETFVTRTSRHLY
jgi:hypothetical protein